jgi:hypothetical protein
MLLSEKRRYFNDLFVLDKNITFGMYAGIGFNGGSTYGYFQSSIVNLMLQGPTYTCPATK